MKNFNTLKVATFNIEKGGFSEYNTDEEFPPKESLISNALSGIHPDALTLTDIFRWDSHYGGETRIAEHLGMRAAFYTPLDDEYLRRGNPEHADELGIIFATNEKVASSDDIDLAGRSASRTILDIGKYGLQVASAYFNHAEEDTRIQQAHALNAQLADMPTIIMGDLNGLRPLASARFSEKARSAVTRLALKMLPSKVGMVDTLRELERREALGVLLDAGFKDGDPKQRPTATGTLPFFGVDYILSRGDGISVSDLAVVSPKGASDHRIVTANVNYQ